MSERKLPMAGTSDGAGAGAVEPAGTASSGGVGSGSDASSVRLVGTLAVAGALAGLAIVLVFQWAQPRIEIYQAKVLAEAVTEVLGGPERYETIFLEDGAFTAAPRGDTASMDRVYVGYGADGGAVGIAVAAAEPGFQDVIRVLFGYDPATGNVLGMKVLESKETPGLGDKIEKDSVFVAAFSGVASPIVGVKKGQGSGLDAEVVMITGATISSRAVIDIINHRLEAIGEAMTAYWASRPLPEGEEGS
ncbi:MAG: FMN-binding protein [Gemmatimonadota bacterium]|nr:FMN-binding protein [Gemmatimonadota bacterium]